jgi:Fe-S-cluster containining protein
MQTYLECQRCAACCRWPGLVRISEAESSAMAAFLDLDESAFVAAYTRLRPDRRGLALNDKENGECIFLNSGKCAVQAVKPQQCRDFPNLWKHPDMADQCRARPMEVSDAEYVEFVRSRLQQST